MVGPNLAEVMQHDGQFVPAAPRAENPSPWCGLGSVLSWLPSETKGGALCRCMYIHSCRLHCEGGSPTGHLIQCLALHMGN